METIALAIAVFALISAWSLRSKLAALEDQLISQGPGSPRDAGLSERVGLNTRFLARLAAGESLAPEQVREGQLWCDVSPEGAAVLIEGGARTLDVRTPAEVAAGIIPGAICIPVDELPERAGELSKEVAATVVYCAMGVRSAAACEYLASQGFDGLVNLDGGFGRWTGDRVRPE